MFISVRDWRYKREFFSMCDYSLEGQPTRDACVHDELVTARIGMYGSVGLVSPDQADTAVCLLPGTRLRVYGDVEAFLNHKFSISPGDLATFGQRDLPEKQVGYRDGLIFDHHPDRPIILFQDLLDGLHVEVISIPVAEHVPTDRVLEDA